MTSCASEGTLWHTVALYIQRGCLYFKGDGKFPKALVMMIKNQTNQLGNWGASKILRANTQPTADLGAATADGRSCLPSAAVGKKEQKASVMPSTRLSCAVIPHTGKGNLCFGGDHSCWHWAGCRESTTWDWWTFPLISSSRSEPFGGQPGITLHLPASQQPFCIPEHNAQTSLGPPAFFKQLGFIAKVSSGSCESLFLLSGWWEG